VASCHFKWTVLFLCVCVCVGESKVSGDEVKEDCV
jgi:hypothetical protein